MIRRKRLIPSPFGVAKFTPDLPTTDRTTFLEPLVLPLLHTSDGLGGSRFKHLFHFRPVVGLPLLAELFKTLFRNPSLDEGQPRSAVNRFKGKSCLGVMTWDPPSSDLRQVWTILASGTKSSMTPLRAPSEAVNGPPTSRLMLVLAPVN